MRKLTREISLEPADLRLKPVVARQKVKIPNLDEEPESLPITIFDEHGGPTILQFDDSNPGSLGKKNGQRILTALTI